MTLWLLRRILGYAMVAAFLVLYIRAMVIMPLPRDSKATRFGRWPLLDQYAPEDRALVARLRKQSVLVVALLVIGFLLVDSSYD